MITSTIRTLEQQQPDAPLGYLVSWNLTGVQIHRPTLETLLDDAGFVVVPDLPTPYIALRHALEGFADTYRKIGVDNETVLVRGFRNAGNANVFILVAEKLDLASFGLDYRVEVRVRQDKTTGVIACFPGGSDVVDPVLSAAVQASFDRCRDLYVTGDLTGLLARLLTHMRGISLGHDGTYFVPAAQQAQLMALKTLVSRLPARESYLITIPIQDSAEGRVESAKSIHDGFLAELTRLSKDFTGLLEQKPGSLRPSTVARRIDLYQQVAQRAVFYRDLLNLRADDILERLQSLSAQAQALVTGDQIGDETAAPEPPAPVDIPESLAA